MRYQKINLELIIDSEESDAVITGLNSALDRLEETCAIFGGNIETTPVEHSGARRKSALSHALEAGRTGTSAVNLAAGKLADAYKKII